MNIRITADTEVPFRISGDQTGGYFISIGGMSPTDSVHRLVITASDNQTVTHLSRYFTEMADAQRAWREGFEVTAVGAGARECALVIARKLVAAGLAQVVA